MAKRNPNRLKQRLAIEEARYLHAQERDGGTADGFRGHVRKCREVDPGSWDSLVGDLLDSAATAQWQAQPKECPLFTIAGYALPETLTREVQDYSDDEPDADADTTYEKVHIEFATVADLYADANIKFRKAAQSTAAAQKRMDAADKAKSRARGDTATLLRDLLDARAPAAA